MRNTIGSCPGCAAASSQDDSQANARKVARLQRKQQQLATVLRTYMSQANLERSDRVARARGLVSVVDRIVGGSPTSEFPECGVIGHRNTNGTINWFCTGVLVHPKIVLTAAHCREARPSVVALNATNIDDLEDAEVVRVRRMEVNQRYRPDESGFDIAMLLLSRAAETPPQQRATTAQIAEAQGVTLVGFGNTDRGSTRGFGEKREVAVPFVSVRRTEDDDLDAAETQFGFESDLEFVAGGHGFDSCNGDSGGPAYLVLPDGTRCVAGLTSRGIEASPDPCGDGGIYTRVDTLAEFLAQTAADWGISDW